MKIQVLFKLGQPKCEGSALLDWQPSACPNLPRVQGPQFLRTHGTIFDKSGWSHRRGREYPGRKSFIYIYIKEVVERARKRTSTDTETIGKILPRQLVLILFKIEQNLKSSLVEYTSLPCFPLPIRRRMRI